LVVHGRNLRAGLHSARFVVFAHFAFAISNAGPARDDHAPIPGYRGFRQQSGEIHSISGAVDHMDPLQIPRRLGQVLEHQLAGRLVVERAAGAGMFLMARSWPWCCCRGS
jgi:hypothetical protein